MSSFGMGVSRRAAQAALGRARQAKRAYRRRYGIETSYRQLNDGKGRTTKKDQAYRLLLVGLALLLRQVITAGAPPSLARLPMTPEEVAASYDDADGDHEDPDHELNMDDHDPDMDDED